MAKEKKNLGLPVPQLVLEKLIKELYNAGMSFYQIAHTLQCKSSDVAQVLKDKPTYPATPPDLHLINEILLNNEKPIATEAIIESEQTRYAKYALMETACLDAMLAVLSHYKSLPVGEDMQRDLFTAKLANDFIKATQQAREELIKRYEVQNHSTVDSNIVQVEYV